MCGIGGFIGSFEPFLLDKINTVMAHRGPDDTGTWHEPEDRVGLAHTRLSIIDLSSAGNQPMADNGGPGVIVFNGEIYNYKELRNQLIQGGVTFSSSSDTEVLLKLYDVYGHNLLKFLNGIFAFAIWDRTKKELFVARDGIGVKPFYYAETQKGFLFASELKALLHEASIDRTIDPEAILSYMTYLWCPAPGTPLKSIRKLEPGSAIIVKDGRIQRKWQFYDLPYDQQVETISVDEAVNKVEQYLQQAVRRQMVADVPVGAYLSGGLDSSSVVAFAQKCLKGNKLQCFTIDFENKDSSVMAGMAADLPYAQKVAKHLGVDLHIVQVGHDMMSHLEKMIYHLDEPQADPAPICALFIAQLAHEHGIKVLLSGTGGDDIFTGYRRHFALQQEKYWSWLPWHVRKGISLLAKGIPPFSPIARRLRKAFQYAELSEIERIVSYFFWMHPTNIASLAGPVLQEHFPYHTSSPLLETLKGLPQDIHRLNKMLYLEGKHFLADHNLNYADKMGMATGVEVRVPLLDVDLISLAARLPVDYKQRGLVGKWIFKKTMEQYLPNDVIYRAKTGFGAPVGHWIRLESQTLLGDLLSERSIKSRGLFDHGAVWKLVELDRNGRIDGAYTIFSIMCIELWCRIFIDNN